MNYAELQKQLDINPTLEQCARQGSTHFAYGWSRTPPMGAKTPAQLDAYTAAYNDARDAARVANNR